MRRLSGKEFVSSLCEYVNHVDVMAGFMRQVMIASTISGDEEHRKMALALLKGLVQYAKKRISTRVDIKDLDRPIDTLVDFYNKVAEEYGMDRIKARALLSTIRRIGFSNRRYFESRDKVKYNRSELETPVNELLERHVKALGEVLGFSLNWRIK